MFPWYSFCIWLLFVLILDEKVTFSIVLYNFVILALLYVVFISKLQVCSVESSLTTNIYLHAPQLWHQITVYRTPVTLGVIDWGISDSNFWPRPLRIRACVISTNSFQSNGNECKRSVYKMAGEIQNRRGVKSKLSVVGLLIELMSDGDDASEEYNDDSLLMEIAVSR